MAKQKLLEEKIRNASKDGRITCAVLRKLSEETGTSYALAGKIADKLDIRIKSCDLGCF